MKTSTLWKGFPTAIRPLTTLASLASVVFLFVGCRPPASGGGREVGSASAAADVSGRYGLVSVNGAKIPTTISHDGAKLQIRSGSLTLKPDGTGGSEMEFVPPSGAVANRAVEATYQRQGAEFTLQWKGAGMTRGRLAGDTFTMTNEDMVLVYRK